MTTTGITNAALVALTGKTTGFPEPSLNVPQDFVAEDDETVLRVRSILTGDSWRVALMLTDIMRSDPYISLEMPPGIISSDGSQMDLNSGAVVGADLIGCAKGPACIAASTVGTADGEITVAYRSDESLLISYDGQDIAVPCSVFNDTLLHVEWPAEMGIIGDVLLPSPYNPATVFSIILPLRYNVEDTLERLYASKNFFSLLGQVDLADAFYFADSKLQQIGIAALAVYKHFIQLQQYGGSNKR